MISQNVKISFLPYLLLIHTLFLISPASGQSEPHFQERIFSWFEQSQADSLQWFRGNHSYLIYDTVQEILNRANRLHLENRTAEAQQAHAVVDWLCQGQNTYFLKLNRLYKSFNVEFRNNKVRADSLSLVAEKQYKQNQLERSIEFRARASAIYSKIGDDFLFERCLHRIGVANFKQANYDRGQDCFNQGLRLSRQIGDKKGEALCLSELGRIARSRGDLAEALKFNITAFDIFKDMHDNKYQTIALNRFGIIFYKMNQFGRAVENYQKMHRLATATDNKSLQGIALGNIGVIYLETGRFFEALKIYHQALLLDREMSYKYGECIHLGNIGLVHKELGNFAEALDSYTSALKIAREIKNPRFEAANLGNIGAIYELEEKYQTALDYYAQAIKINIKLDNQKGLAVNHTNSGTALVNLHNRTEAIIHLQQALEFAQKANANKQTGSAFLNLSDYYFAGNQLRAAKDYAVQALSFGKLAMNPAVSRLAHLSLAKLNQKSGDDSLYVFHLNQAVNMVRLTRSKLSGLFLTREFYQSEGVFEIYFRLVEYWVNAGDFPMAYEYVQELKAQLLIEQIQLHHVQLPQDSLVVSLEKVNTQLKMSYRRHERVNDDSLRTHLTAEITRLEVTKKELWSEICAKYPQFDQLFNPGSVPVSAIQEGLISPRQAILDYVVGEDNTVIFVITADSLVALTTGLSRDSLHQLINLTVPYFSDSRNLAEKYQVSAFDVQSAFRLYVQLFKPVEKFLEGISSLIIVPDDRLAYLPFEMLVSDEKGARTLMEEYAFSYLPSSNLPIAGEGEPGKSGARLLAFANPALADSIDFKNARANENYPPLLQAENEVRTVATLVKGQAYFGEDATESHFKREGTEAGIIHVATHSVVEDRMPMYSRLILARGFDSENDGYLNAYEIYNMTLKAELVVLSACETGVGKMSRGEGLASLARGFFHAGGKSMLASLWQVDDAATAKIMNFFYQGLKKGMRKDVALQQAKIKYLKDAGTFKKHPYFWAGHVLMGSASAVHFDSSPSSVYFLLLPIFLLLVYWFVKIARRSLRR